MFERLSLSVVLLSVTMAWSTFGGAIGGTIAGASAGHVEAGSVATELGSTSSAGVLSTTGNGARAALRTTARGIGHATGATVRGVGRTVDTSAAGLERVGLGKLGKGLTYMFGSETLARSSVEVAGGLTLLFPWLHLGETPLINFSYVGKYWTGHLVDPDAPLSREFYRMRGVHTPVFGLAIDDAAGVMKSAQLPFVSGYIAERAYGVTLGLQNVGLLKNVTGGPLGAIGALGLGHYADRAAYMGIGGGFSLMGPIGAGFGVTVFYPPLEKLVRAFQIERAAGWVQRTERRIADAVRSRIPPRVSERWARISQRFRRRQAVSNAPDLADANIAGSELVDTKLVD